MQYTTEVKKIGGSCYLRLPPKVARDYKLKDEQEVELRESDKMIVITTEKPKIDQAGQEFLELMKEGAHLGGKTITREEIYETDRY
jgi:antitoxin component of MazEF toxin-antitoxin module